MIIPYIDEVNLSSEIDLLRLQANSNLDAKRRSSLGQFFTPAPIGQFMASLFTNLSGDIRLLEPGCGIGSIIANFTDEVIRRGGDGNLDVTCYDIETIIEPYLSETLQRCKDLLLNKNVSFESEFIHEDFILHAAELLNNNLFSGKRKRYTHILMNPSYKKINAGSEHRVALSKTGIETVNLYTGFVALAIKLLEPNGELVAIIPRSFCNGPYYYPFRTLLLEETALRHIHIFEKRDHAFGADEVLQENIILPLLPKK